MKMSRLALLVSVPLVFGIVIGVVVAVLVCEHFAKELFATFTAATMSQEVTELRNIRDGHADQAAKLLEIHLDGDIIAAAMRLEKVPSSRRDPSLVSALEQARDYRHIFPHTVDSPEDETLIKKAFSLIDGEKTP
jgi:hypothetical protein